MAVQSSRIITIIFTMETSTSDGISLGTELFLSKFTILWWNSHYPIPTVIFGDKLHFRTQLVFIKNVIRYYLPAKKKSKGRVQRSMVVTVTSGMKNPPEKLEFLQFLPRFQASTLLFLRNSYLLKNLIIIFRNTVDIVFQQIIKVTVIKAADKANQH